MSISITHGKTVPARNHFLGGCPKKIADTCPDGKDKLHKLRQEEYKKEMEEKAKVLERLRKIEEALGFPKEEEKSELPPH